MKGKQNQASNLYKSIFKTVAVVLGLSRRKAVRGITSDEKETKRYPHDTDEDEGGSQVEINLNSSSDEEKMAKLGELVLDEGSKPKQNNKPGVDSPNLSSDERRSVQDNPDKQNESQSKSGVDLPNLSSDERRLVQENPNFQSIM